MTATPAALLKAIAPTAIRSSWRPNAWLPGTWLADLWAEHGLPVVRGHALSRKASPGGQAKHEQIDAHTIAVLLRGGMFPQADVDPAEMRATRDLLRRRMPLARKRGALVAHVQQTTSQYHLPAIGNNIAYQTNRDGVAERFADPAVHKSIEVDRALITDYAKLLRDVELTILNTAKHPDAHTLDLLQTVPSIGKILSLVLLYESQQLDRFPRGQAFASSGRLVTCAKASAGKRAGTAGAKIGHAHLQWAFSDAAVLCLRDHPAGQTFLRRLEKKHSTGKALTIFAHKLARAVDPMVQHQTAFAMSTFLHSYGRGVGKLDASRDHQGMTLTRHALQGTKACVSERR